MIPGKRILVVDDDKINLSIIQTMLQSMGYKPVGAYDGTEALDKLGQDIDLVLLDVMMPGMDGFEVARRIRADPEYWDLPIIMVTALTKKADRLSAVEAGANDFISKPVDRLELKVRVESLLKMKAAQDQVKQHRAELETMVEKRTEQLRESEERFRAIFEAAQDCIFVQDRDLRYTHVNPFMERLLERPAARVIGLTDAALFGRGDGKHDKDVGERVLRGQTVEEERTRIVNGLPTVFHEIRVPITDRSGRIIGVCGIARNITERKMVQSGSRAPAETGYSSTAMRSTLEKGLAVGKGDSTVLLTGESGSGKDYLARYIHDHSRRAHGPYLAINCAAIAPELAESELFGHEAGAFTGAARRKKGLLELAEGGTLFLNEIGELSLPIQAKLLSFLDTRTFCRVGGERSVSVNARLIAATNRDLEDDVGRGRFRADLFYRLNVYRIRIPPLRERTEDIPILVRQLMSSLAAEMKIDQFHEVDSASMEMLCRYSWPGNVRELRNVLERSLILSTDSRLHFDLGETACKDPGKWSWSAAFPPDKPLNDLVQDLKRSLISEALERSSGRKIEAARLLNITRDALKRQMTSLGFYEGD